jgi:C-terminal processing protease CtpA/Prc
VEQRLYVSQGQFRNLSATRPLGDGEAVFQHLKADNFIIGHDEHNGKIRLNNFAGSFEPGLERTQDHCSRVARQNRTIRIENVFLNTPASQTGLQAGLIVRKIDDIPTADKSTDWCASLIRGKSGTKVRLELVSPERNETNTVELIRHKFVMPGQ